MNAHILPIANVNYLDHIFTDFKLKIMPAAFYEQIPQEHLALWCHNNGIYGLPTTELIDWLRLQITPKTIEIGSGNGAIGRELGIPTTDSCFMRRPDVALLYTLQGQPTTKYPDDIEELSAVDAIEKYQPEVVIGCWVTHKYREDEHWRSGNMYGIDEDYILSKVKKYIVIGNEVVHSQKRILQYKHQELKFPWLYSRSMNISGNTIYVWETNEI